MAVARPRIAVGLALATLAATGLVLVTQNGGGPKQVSQTYATAQRGVVDTTVGGIGHVTTLTGAALLSVPSSSSTSASGGGTSTTTSVSPSGTGATAPAPVPADAVFPTLAGHVSRLFVQAGEKVAAGQPVARISDSGATVGTVLQARLGHGQIVAAVKAALFNAGHC